ncbi:MAG: hypothetical protein PF569_10205 [Candidatus Woesearchaeota archaeon]|jgi:Ni,Fe-hydrogenase III component G|nr:hypothetical protein [Candidatus Woesearchaeota archaeon]
MAENKTFYLENGKTFNNLKGFAKNLKDMTHETLKHHVNEAKNDFANWVKYSMKEDDLSIKIGKKIDKIELELEVLRHLVHDEAKKKAAPVKKAVVKKKPATKTKPTSKKK